MCNRLADFTFLFLVFFISITSSYTQDYQSTDDGFANFLYSSELYKLAAEEYERLFYYQPDNIAVLKKLIASYAKCGKDNLIDLRFDMLETQDKDLALSYYDLLLSIDKIDKLESLFDKQRPLFTKEEGQDVDFRIAIAKEDWSSARMLYKAGSLTKYQPLMEKIESARYKKPGLAAGLSTLIPGLGRVYAKDTKDGIVSLIFVASFAYQAYRRFDQKGIDSVGGWVFGGLALGFHISNIYGSYQSAKFYNKQVNDKIHRFSMPYIITDNK